MAIRVIGGVCPIEATLNALIQSLQSNGDTTKIFAKEDAISNTQGYEFIVINNPQSLEIANGSIKLFINGVLYNSNQNQLDNKNTDFYLTTNRKSVVLHNKLNGGIDLSTRDLITIIYRIKI